MHKLALLATIAIARSALPPCVALDRDAFRLRVLAAASQCLVKEYFGLKELAKIQPIIYGCVIVGCMGGMVTPKPAHRRGAPTDRGP